ncbi:MAG: hemolysin III family protein [Firmicutes bacterium]|nr:hemolysin III family protein [Bacillota bacterium]
MKRTPIGERPLPNYTRSQELANMWTHIAGILLGLALLPIIILKSRGPLALFSGCLYAVSMICLYSVSSVYHGLRPCMGKRVMRAVDHCTIYFLIAGTYSPILLAAILPLYPGIAWGIFAAEWCLGLFAVVFTAVDLERFGKLSMCCYIGMGWLVVLALKPTLEALGTAGFLWLLWGGISYTLGAVIYGLGKKKPWLHTVFHVFVLLGSALHAVCVLNYVF